MSKQLSDNEMEKAAGGQIEQVNIQVTDINGDPKTITKYNVFSDDPLNRRKLIARDVDSLDMANFIAEKANVNAKITGVYNRNRKGFSEEELGKFNS